MKKTITQRFFLSLCLMIVGCLWGTGNSAWAETITLSQETIGSLLGTGYASTDFIYSDITWGRSNAYKNNGGIQIKAGTSNALWNKTAIPGAITKIVVTQKTNPSTLTVGSTAKPTTNSNSTAESSTATYEFNASDKFQYFKIAATSKYTVVTSIEITYEPLAAINVSADAFTFGDVETGYNAEKTFILSGKNLTPNSTASLTLDDYSNFSVSPTSVNIDSEGNIAETKVTVTYAPTTVSEHSATLTIKSGDITETVSLSGTGVTRKNHYTVTWMVNGASYSTSDVAEGEQLTLPANPEAIGSKVFIGWTDSAISSTSASAPEVLFTTSGNAPSVTSNTTYYAVFAKILSSTSSWNRVKKLAEITDGSYVIKNDAYILPSTTTTDKSPEAVTAPEIIDDEITGSVEESMVWHFSSTGTTNQFYVRNAGGSYLYANSSNTGLRVSSTIDKWVFSVNTSTYFSMEEVNNSRYCAKYKAGNDWRSYNSPTASNYANSGKLELYKLFSENTYTDYTTTVATLADRNLSFGETTAFDVYGNTFSAPTLTGTTTGVTYASSNTSVATVNESTGAVTLEGGFGTTTITASAAEDATYLAGEASYTLSVWPTSIAGLKTMVTGTVDFKAQLTNATITYVNDRNVYLQDADAAILMYLDSEHGLTARKSYTGLVSGTATLYKGLREITSIDLSSTTSTDNNTIEPEVVTLAELNDNYDKYESKYVKVAGVTTGTFTTSDPVQTTTLTQNEATLAFAAPSTITLLENNDYDFVGFLGKYQSTPQFKIYEESQATNKGKLAAGLVFEQASYTAEVDELITVKATNASDAAITYSVNDETNCLVDENKGEFVAYAAGTYTITATCPATETHMAGTATCQVTVTMPASNISATTYYKKITSTDELVDGGVYLIVCEAENEAMGSLNSSSSRGEGKPITISGNTYTGKVNQSGYPYEITISQAKNGNYNLYHASGYFINGKNGNDLVFSTTTGDDGWSVIFDEDGNVEISNSKKEGNYIQRYTTNNYYKNYSSTGGGQTPVQLYQKVGEMSIVQVTGGITTYVADFAYSMPQHLVGHTVELADKADVIITEKAFRAGDEVPALTPLLIKSTEDFAADETKTYYPAVLNKTVAAYAGANMLEYQRDASNMTKSKKTNVYYYKLAIKSDVVGFYWGEPEGGAFKMTKPSTAYLTVPKTMPVQGFVLNFEEGEPTGIATVTTDENAPIYNLQGIRMNGKNLPKGIYIQGGKKFMVK